MTSRSGNANPEPLWWLPARAHGGQRPGEPPRASCPHHPQARVPASRCDHVSSFCEPGTQARESQNDLIQLQQRKSGTSRSTLGRMFRNICSVADALPCGEVGHKTSPWSRRHPHSLCLVPAQGLGVSASWNTTQNRSALQQCLAPRPKPAAS